MGKNSSYQFYPNVSSVFDIFAAAAEGFVVLGVLLALVSLVAAAAAATDTDIGFPGLVDALLVLVQDADGAVLADAVAHLKWIDPNSQF